MRMKSISFDIFLLTFKTLITYVMDSHSMLNYCSQLININRNYIVSIRVQE